MLIRKDTVYACLPEHVRLYRAFVTYLRIAYRLSRRERRGAQSFARAVAVRIVPKVIHARNTNRRDAT